MATLNRKNLFVGYSTVKSSKHQRLVDIQLVNQDLLNHFNTRIGERVMMPKFGCGVWDYLFEPFDETTKSAIIYEATQVVQFDPRVTLREMNVTQFDNGISISMNLFYVPFQALATFVVNFDKRSQDLG